MYTKPQSLTLFVLTQGTGGLEAVILDADGTTTGVINDQFGNGVATVTGTGAGASVTWNSTRVGAYGPLPGITPQTLGDVTQLAAATAWRSRRIDPTGFYFLGARYYEPTSGRFLSADPIGHAASPSLYDYAGGDPVNRTDPDGRCASKMAQFMSDPIGNAGLLNDIYSDLKAINDFNAQNSASSMAGADSSPTSRKADRSQPADQLDVEEGPLTLSGDAGAKIDRYFNVKNPSQDGFIMQHVVRNGDDYWEVWPVTVSKDPVNGDTVSYSMGNHDFIKFADLSSEVQTNKQWVKVEAVWMPGYVLSPNDHWEPGGINRSGSLLLHDGPTPPPAGWPAAGDNVIGSGYVQLSAKDSSNTWSSPRSVTAGFSGATGVQTQSGDVPPWGRH